MKVLVFGRSGQVARELARQGGHVTCLGRDQADLRDPQSCLAAIAGSAADVIINAAAYTAVDGAETDRETAELVNGIAPGVLAKAAVDQKIPFIHISTDYVFDGSGTDPWQPDDAPSPLGVYGVTKLAGERAVAAAGGAFVILRTSWVFSASGNNFVRTMLRLGAERSAQNLPLNIVADQVGGPTAAHDIAEACMTIARHLSGANANAPDVSGIYHFSGGPDVSWAEFAREIFAQAKLDVTVTDIPTSAYPTHAQRPLNSRLGCSRTEDVFGLTRPDWRRSLHSVLNALDAAQKERS